MKAKNIILLAFFIYATCSKGQVWQHTYGVIGNVELARGVSSSFDNGYIINIDRNDRQILLLKADINGETLWLKTYLMDNNQTSPLLSFSTHTDGTIYQGGSLYEGNNRYSFLIKTDECGRYSWCKKITYNGENSIAFVKVLDDGNILIETGGVSSNPMIDRFQIWEIDPDGNIIWMNQVMPGTQYYFDNTQFFQMCLSSDGGSIMAGYTYYPCDTLNKPWDAILQPCLVKCNDQGTMQWVYPPLSGADTNRIGFFNGCTQIGNYYYAVGAHYDTVEYSLRPLIARFDLNGQLLNYKLLLPDTTYMQLSNVISASDTSILLISAGSKVYTDPNYLVVFLADTLGNFQKSFTRTDLVVGQFGDEVAKMRYNKFIIPCQSPIGWPGPLTDVVAIKLNANLEYDSVYTQAFTYDSLCPYPIVSDTIICNCEPFVSVKEAEKSMGKITISPNPAKEWFTVGFPRSLQQAGKVSIYDMLGRVQYSEVLTPGQKQTKINCEGWKSGLYFVRCQTGGKVLSGKVVIF